MQEIDESLKRQSRYPASARVFTARRHGNSEKRKYLFEIVEWHINNAGIDACIMDGNEVLLAVFQAI
jgi:hypothetical protein